MINTDSHIDTSTPDCLLTGCLPISTHGLFRAERRLLRGTNGPHRAAGHRQDGESGAPDTDPITRLRAGI